MLGAVVAAVGLPSALFEKAINKLAGMLLQRGCIGLRMSKKTKSKLKSTPLGMLRCVSLQSIELAPRDHQALTCNTTKLVKL